MSAAEKSGYILKFKGIFQLGGINAVIFYGIGIFNYLYVFHTGHGMIHSILDIFRQGTGHTSNVHFIRSESLWFNEHLMSVLICKFNYLILDGWAVPRTYSLYFTGIKRRTIQIFTDNRMRFFVCIRKPAAYLLNLYTFRVCLKGKRNNTLITELLGHLRIINCSSIYSGRSSGFEPAHPDSVFLKGIRQMIGRLQSVRSGIIAHISVYASGSQVCSGTKYSRAAVINSS